MHTTFSMKLSRLCRNISVFGLEAISVNNANLLSRINTEGSKLEIDNAPGSVIDSKLIWDEDKSVGWSHLRPFLTSGWCSWWGGGIRLCGILQRRGAGKTWWPLLLLVNCQEVLGRFRVPLPRRGWTSCSCHKLGNSQLSAAEDRHSLYKHLVLDWRIRQGARRQMEMDWWKCLELHQLGWVAAKWSKSRLSPDKEWI